jgi:23S rRNA pseudouridine1911/1915/1917 synthase
MPAARPPGAGRRVVIGLPRERRGERLDRALAALLPDQSRAAVRRLLDAGRVVLGTGPARPAYRVRGGERIVVDLPGPEPSPLRPEPLPLRILHEDGDLVVIDKPAGMAVHPGAGARGGTLVNALLHHCRDLSGVGGVERPGIVHRLDRDTTGVLVVAKNDAAHRDLALQFKSRRVRKVYEALVWGRPRSAEGLIDRPIGRHPAARVRMTVRPDGREARTRYRIAALLGPVTLLELRPETGRTHQLRVHLCALGHPIVGDRTYGGARRAVEVREPRAREALREFRGLALHARSLGFAHPRTGEWRLFEAPRPPGLAALIEALRRAGGGGPEAEGRP